MCVSLRFRADRVPPVIPVICLWVLGLPAAPAARAQPAAPSFPPLEAPAPALEADVATGANAAQLGIPLCETTGFEANEPTCNWEAGYGICGSTFMCRDTAVDGPYLTTCEPPLTQPDNCCVNAPNPNTGWYMSITSQHCQQPHISTENPASGSQHLRFDRSAQGGVVTGCVGLSTSCRLSAFTPNVNPGAPNIPFHPGITTTSFDVSRSDDAGNPGMQLLWSNESISEGLVAQRILFNYIGYVFAADYDIAQYVFLGYMYAGIYHHIDTTHDVCGDEILYYYDGELMHVGSWSRGASQQVQSIERNVWLSDNNKFGFFDVDNFSVTRGLISEPTCEYLCGDSILSSPWEECDFGTNGSPLDSCCPGSCGAPGSANECQCPDPTNTLENCTARELFNGINGPFYSDGGFYSYTADAPFTSISTCDSDFDTQIFWNLTADCADYETFNDECFADDYGGYQQPGDPNASCYGGANPPPGYQACLCTQTIPGTTYTFLIAEWAPASQGGTTHMPPFCSSTMVEITKKTSCDAGGVIPGGACCDQLTGTCTEGVAAEECADEFDVYSDNKLCSMVDCEAVTGACCNTAPGAGGACTETLHAECPESLHQLWTPLAVCGDVTCEEVTGSCCNTLTGGCATAVTQDQCGAGLDFVWTEGGTCNSCTLRLGACCIRPDNLTAECNSTSVVECDAAGGAWSDSQPCSAADCTPNFIIIPTVSEWGLVVLALVLIVGGKVYWGSVGRIPRQGKP